MSAHLFNIMPTTTLSLRTPFEVLYRTSPSYDHLRVFGCLCYPNLNASSPHKLSPRSTACVFLGYPLDHKGFRCLDLVSHRVIISHHVVFDENVFPFSTLSPLSSSSPSPSSLTPSNDETSPLVRLQVFDPPLSPRAHRTVSPTGSVPADPSSPVSPPGSVPAEPPAFSFGLPGFGPTPPGSCAGPPGSVHTPSSALVPAAPCASGSASSDRPALSSTLPASSTVTRVPGGPLPGFPPLSGSSSEPPPSNSHPMITRSKAGISKPRIPFNLSVTSSSLSPIRRSYKEALRDPNWKAAMDAELSALHSNGTWVLVPPPPSTNIVESKWIFRHKFRADGSLDRYKARLVAQGFSQQPGIDYEDTFSPVVKPATICTVLSLALSRSWPIHQLDVKNAFLHGTLSETVYMQQLPDFAHPDFPDHVCHLHKALYGLKQAPRAWHHRFASFLISLGFIYSRADSSLFVFRQATHTAFLLLYVDDIVLTASSPDLLSRLTSRLSFEFAMTDLGPLYYFLGISVSRSSSGLFLSQTQFAKDILARAKMTSCKPVSTPVDTQTKLSSSSGSSFSDPTLYRSLAGALQYLTFTRPDLQYAVQQLCLFMHDPKDQHMTALKRVVRYVQGTLTHGLSLRPSPSHQLIAYYDADWAGCPDTRRSSSGFYVFLGDNLIS